MRGHGLDDGHQVAEPLFVDLDIGQIALEAQVGQHAHDIVHGAQFFDLLQLAQKIIEAEFVLQHAPRKDLGLLLVKILFRLLDQGQHVAHAQDLRGQALGVEFLQIGGFFADADELDRLAGDADDGKGGPAAGVGVELGQDDRIDADLFRKSSGPN